MLRTLMTRTLTRSLIRPIPAQFLRPPRPILHQKTFSATSHPQKKAREKSSKARSNNDDGNAQGRMHHPFDFASHFESLERKCNAHIDKLKADIAKLRARGRNEPGILENLQVVLDKSTGASASLRDIAHVLPKGRTLIVNVHEAPNFKHVIAAIQKADLNVQPMPDPKNAQSINVPLPPPTKETRMEIADIVGKAGVKVLELLRSERQDSHKLIKRLRRERLDDIRSANKQLEVVMKKINTEAKIIIEDAKKGALEN
ncbi:ribosome recycling factor [Tuber magnatum]|uniref:Ribosome recycling factor n=1 Tax=Tuber magnatum TaxID=42249 RepID=A0A317SII7_9PEZI|nr:ribosome recycling factor [Tuber magnatum]